MNADRIRSLTVVGLLTLTACYANPTSAPPTTTEATASETASASASSSAPVPDLVGEWERETRCEEIVEAIRDAEMDDWVLDFASAFFPDGEVAGPAHPCDGATPLRHSHFFTADGRFGSRDENGDQVDDGTYEIIDDRTLVISNYLGSDTLKLVTFHYVIDGDTISFEPVIPDCRPDCFEAVWSVTVAYPGQTWTRVATH